MKKRWLFLFFLILLPFAITAYQAYAGEPGYNVSCAEHAAGANACNTNGCFLCSSGTWTPQPFYIGASSATCSSSYTGMMRYNSGSLEYCNGSAWTALAAGSTTNVYTGSNEPYLRFSSTTAAYSATDSTKDSACTTDFGSNFQAAQLPDVAAYMHGGISTYTYFNVAGNTSNSFASIESGSGGIYIYQYAGWPYSVACVRKDAPVLFSRTTVAYSASDSSKNSTCSTDFGANYEAGSALDLAANIKAYLYTGAFNVRGDASYSYYTGSSNGGIWLNSMSGWTYPVVCMKKAPSSSSVSVCSTITHSSTLYGTATSTTWTPPFSASEACPVPVRILVVGGGGGGGSNASSCTTGGASGYVYSQQLSITSTSALTVTVGAGGGGGSSSAGTAGSSSVFGTITVGGGSGGSASGTAVNGGGGSGRCIGMNYRSSGGVNGRDGGNTFDGSSIGWGGQGQLTPFVSSSVNTRDAAGLIFQSATFAAGSAGSTDRYLAGAAGGILINNTGTGGASGTGGSYTGSGGTGYGGGGGGSYGGGTGGTGSAGAVYIEW